MTKLILSAFCLFILLTAQGQGQSNQPTQKMDFEAYNPKSTLVVPEHPLTRARFPFIDVHNHQNNMSAGNLQKLLQEMDKLNMKVLVNLSGGSGQNLKSKIDNIKSTSPNRFIVFANVDFRGVGEPGWGEKAAKALEEDAKNGANERSRSRPQGVVYRAASAHSHSHSHSISISFPFFNLLLLLLNLRLNTKHTCKQHLPRKKSSIPYRHDSDA